MTWILKQFGISHCFCWTCRWWRRDRDTLLARLTGGAFETSDGRIKFDGRYADPDCLRRINKS